jgi:hypothetical protein
MEKIRDLFDPSRKLSRPIEKVITYQNRSDEQLRAEVSEYVVTEHLEQNFHDLLDKMQRAQQGDGGHEIGVWVSGFYGSGKSSFTKYLGFSLDREMEVGGTTFLQLLQNQLNSAKTRGMFNQVSKTYDAAVVFLDLASEMLAGASMADISTVLYLKVLQWAGYSEDLKVAELERMLEAEGKLTQFEEKAKPMVDGLEWKKVHNQPLIANPVASALAAEFYPKIFKSTADFNELALNIGKTENKRAEEMIELIKRKSGKKNVIFVIDEVGQYVSAKPSLILNLDGLAKNLKQIGGGGVWIFATAQQTLTEDNASAALNTPGLYKLKDRFPIQVHLEASDIKEICHKRLLKKSADGEKQLGALFDKSGAELRNATKLTDAGVYSTELTKQLFIDLYPFLPAHFEILLQLLGRLAKKTGGLGLRSAIKVVQEVLVEPSRDQAPLADSPAGHLANTVTFYDSLRRDIMSSFPHVVEGVKRVHERMPNDPLCQQVAKSIAVLQILENLPVTPGNIAALLHLSVDASSMKEDVEKAVSKLLGDGMIPLGEKNGSLRFMTQAAVTLQGQFDQMDYRQADVRAELNSVVRAIFLPLPTARVAQTKTVRAGLRMVIGGGQSVSLEGEKEAIQMHVEFVPDSNYTAIRTERENDSRSARERSSIYLLGRTDSDADRLATTMVRCRKFLDLHRTASDADTQDFVRTVEARLDRASHDLERKMANSLLQGSFVAHGAHESISARGADVLTAAGAFLGDAAARVFDKYSEAAHEGNSGLAEKFLTTPLDRITSKEDPLGLVTRAGGRPQIKTDHRAIVSITDYLGQSGQTEGRRLLDNFAAAPFGWSKETTLYLIAAAFLGGAIKLRIAGEDHQVKSDESLRAFSSTRGFGAVGVSLRDEKPDPDALLKSSNRLRDLTGENVMPLEDEIAALTKKHFPLFQNEFGPLSNELIALGLPQERAERAESLMADLAEIVRGDGSDAVKRLGGQDSPLHQDLLWARSVKKALDNGLRDQLRQLKRLRDETQALPDSGIPGKLKVDAELPLEAINEILRKENFFEEGVALAQQQTLLDQLIVQTVDGFETQQQSILSEALSRWEATEDWRKLDEENREWIQGEVANLKKTGSRDVQGLRELLNHDFNINHRLRELEGKIVTLITKGDREKEEGDRAGDQEGDQQNSETATLILPESLETAQDIESLIDQLSGHLASIKAGKKVLLKCQLLRRGK